MTLIYSQMVLVTPFAIAIIQQIRPLCKGGFFYAKNALIFSEQSRNKVKK